MLGNALLNGSVFFNEHGVTFFGRIADDGKNSLLLRDESILKQNSKEFVERRNHLKNMVEIFFIDVRDFTVFKRLNI